ncbi:MAG: hypothetical protein JJE46_15905 [Acidimicrobiia bacterium]|nr:hypothetical protein [Acidimicrobiia bacterium]
MHWGNDTYIVVSATTNANGSTAPDSGDQHVVSVFRTGKGGGVLGWPMFKNNLKRTGTYDDSVPPTVTGSVTAAPAGSTRMLIELTASDAETGVAGVDIEVRQDTDRWVRYLTRSGPTGSAGTTVTPRRSLFGLAGHRYSVRVRGWDRAGNRSPWRVVGSRFLGPAATRSQPFDVAYTASANGTVGGVSSPPVAAPPIPGNLGRGVVAAPGGGGYTLDGFGGLHPFGGAPALRGGAYWPGWDVARGVVLDRTGAGGLVVDAFGGLHPFGAQRAPTSRAGYWPGWDVVRGITLTPDSTLRNPRGYVADAFGGIHPFGGAPKVRNSGYWLGWDIVRGIATDPSGPGGYVLDGFGAVHPFGGAPARAPGQYWAGRDTARGIALISGGSAGRGYVLEGTGRVVPFGGAPAVQTVVRWPAVGSRGLAIAP